MGLMPPGNWTFDQFLDDDRPAAERDGMVHSEQLEANLGEALERAGVLPTLAQLADVAMITFQRVRVGRPGAVSNWILTQAFNDLTDLIDLLHSGRGRPAALVARTLFEHLVNFCIVEDCPAEAERYEAGQAPGSGVAQRDPSWA